MKRTEGMIYLNLWDRMRLACLVLYYRGYETKVYIDELIDELEPEARRGRLL